MSGWKEYFNAVSWLLHSIFLFIKAKWTKVVEGLFGSNEWFLKSTPQVIPIEGAGTGFLFKANSLPGKIALET